MVLVHGEGARDLVWPGKESGSSTWLESEGTVGGVAGYEKRFLYKAREQGLWFGLVRKTVLVHD